MRTENEPSLSFEEAAEFIRNFPRQSRWRRRDFSGLNPQTYDYLRADRQKLQDDRDQATQAGNTALARPLSRRLEYYYLVEALFLYLAEQGHSTALGDVTTALVEAFLKRQRPTWRYKPLKQALIPGLTEQRAQNRERTELQAFFERAEQAKVIPANPMAAFDKALPKLRPAHLSFRTMADCQAFERFLQERVERNLLSPNTAKLYTRNLRIAAAPKVDYAGAVLLTVGVLALLIGLFELGTALGWALLVLAALLLSGLVWVERRAADPIVPLHLFQGRLFATACAQGVLSGWAMLGSLSFVPLFVQAVLGTSATAAGATLTPLLLGWVFASIIGSRLLLRLSYRTLALLGMGLLTLGALLMSRVGVNASQVNLMVNLALMGVGMGLSIPAFLIAVQSTVRSRDMGAATSTVQFSRSIGGTLGVSVMGVALSFRLAARLTEAGLDPAVISVDSLLNPLAQTATNLVREDALRNALAGAIQGVFVIAFIAAALGLVATAFAPPGRIAQLVAQRAGTENTGQPAPTSVSGR